MREDLGPAAGRAHERIVGRHRAVVFQAQHLAEDGGGGLRIGQASGAAHRDVEQAVGTERHARAASLHGVAGVELLHVREPCAVVAAARQGKREGRGVERLVIREVDPAVVGEARMQGQVEHAGGAAQAHGRQAGQRRRVEHAATDGPHLAGGPHAHQEVAVRQRQQAPRPLDAVGHHTHPHLLPEQLVDPRLGGQRKPGTARRWGARLREHHERAGGHARDDERTETSNRRRQHPPILGGAGYFRAVAAAAGAAGTITNVPYIMSESSTIVRRRVDASAE